MSVGKLFDLPRFSKADHTRRRILGMLAFATSACKSSQTVGAYNRVSEVAASLGDKSPMHSAIKIGASMPTIVAETLPTDISDERYGPPSATQADAHLVRDEVTSSSRESLTKL